MKKLLLKILPDSIKKRLYKIYLSIFFRNKLKPIDEDLFKQLLTDWFELKKGDVVFIHSAMSKIKFSFSIERLVEMILEVIGEEGTILLPCWEIDTNAKNFLTNNPDYVFDVDNTKTKLGKLSEYVRNMKGAYRSQNPINSVVGFGKHAEHLLSEHHLDIYSCGKKSPFYKMLNYPSKIIGLGVDFRYLTFMHCVEDCNEFKYSVKTRYDEIFKVKVKKQGVINEFETLVAHENIGHRDVPGYFKKNIDPKIASTKNVNGSMFFKANANKLYFIIGELAEKNITIYTEKAFEK